MSKIKAEGRELFYESDLTLLATVAPVPDYASAIGVARRLADLWNASDGMPLDEAVRRLRAR